MTTATIVQRFTKSIKWELNAAIEAINAEAYGWSIEGDGQGAAVVVDADEVWPIQFHRNGEEIIALPEFYICEGIGSQFTGSKGNTYELAEDGETLVMVAA
jgi:hypothetical protein